MLNPPRQPIRPRRNWRRTTGRCGRNPNELKRPTPTPAAWAESADYPEVPYAKFIWREELELRAAADVRFVRRRPGQGHGLGARAHLGCGQCRQRIVGERHVCG